MTGAYAPPESWWADDEPVAGLDFGLAVEAGEFEQAFRLLHDQYVWRGYMAAHPSGRRLSLHNALPMSKVFVAKAGARVIGTVSVIQDSPMGLPIDEVFGAELGRLRERGRRLAEASGLALDPAHRASGVAILARLFRIAVLYAARVARLDDLCFVVHPRHREFYLRAFPFRRFDDTRAYRRLAGAPVTAFCLDLRLVRALMRVVRAGLSPGPFAEFLAGPEACREVTARLRRDLPRATLAPHEWARLFGGTAGPVSAQADLSAFLLATMLAAVNPMTGGQS